MSSTSWRDEVVGLIPALRAFAWSLSHNGSDADDLVQDTLERALSRWTLRRSDGDLRAWLAGLRFDLADAGPFDLQATAFAGVTDGDDLAGSDGAEGTLFGLAARASYALIQAAPGGFVYDAPWLAATQRLQEKGYRAGGARPDRTIDGEARKETTKS